ncbi:MAG: arginine--tRNA ligase [Candidatus Lambdaproteobacteria bacterium]|nr:arginine--tRNA ligase [Candidatus Lambdaproteobacteria bacterium]
MDEFAETIVALIAARLQALGVAPVPEIPPGKIERPPDAALGDYAFPCFLLAKALRKAPPQIAAELAAGLREGLAGQALFTDVQAAGPYVNFRVSTAALAARVLPAVLDGSYFQANLAGSGRKVMVEYSQPNTHKAFHVGHMRNVALGDALARILAYNGDQVVAANYIGDSGTHIAKCLWYYQRHRAGDPPPPGRGPFAAQARGEWLGELYTAATLLLEDAAPEQRAQFDAEVRAVLQQLEARSGEAYALWRETRQWSLDAFEEIYRWLDARFDHVFYESDMELGRQIVDEGLRKGVFVRSQGAVGIDFGEELSFFLVLKADGTTLYSTKDLALAQIKFERFGIEESIYVVGAEQTLHFKQVFATLERLGYPQAHRCRHVAYALVMLPEGKMSSRAGNVILFSRLREALDAYIFGNYLDAHRGDWDEAELRETARRLAVAGIRYGMVKQDPTRQITFNLGDWLVSEGNTGTYLCYAYTRIMSVGRMVPEAPDPRADFALLTQDTEKALLRELYDFNRHVRAAGAALQPNLVAGALYALAQAFSSAYHTSPVKQADNAPLRAARLALFHATARVMHQGLALLGITPPERM